MIKVSTSGSFDDLKGHISRARQAKLYRILNKYGKIGVEELMKSTPIKTGKTAASWYYTVSVKPERSVLEFCNSNIVDGYSVAMIIEYGHATRSGTYVEGVDYISPALGPVFKDISDAVWREVSG